MFKSIVGSFRLLMRKHKEPFVNLKQILGFTPCNLEVYEQALHHKSASMRIGKGKWANNERLEFLGDAVLDNIIADILYHRFEEKREGFLTNTRSKIVQRDSMNKIATDLGLDKLLVVSSSVKAQNSCIYGNALEALIAAIYLDRGYRKAKKFVETRIINAYFNLDELSETEVNFKSRLIEWGQKNRIDIQFNLLELYTNHLQQQVFETEIRLGDIPAGKGKGGSKKESQQRAAESAFKRLHSDPIFRRELLERIRLEREEAERDTASMLASLPKESATEPLAQENPQPIAEKTPVTVNTEQENLLSSEDFTDMYEKKKRARTLIPEPEPGLIFSSEELNSQEEN